MFDAVAEFSAFIDRSRHLGGDVAGYASREGELLEQFLHALFILCDFRVKLAVCAFQVDISYKGWAAVARAGDEDGVQVVFFDGPIEVDIDEVQAGRSAPMSQEARFDIFEGKGFLEQWISEKVDLSDGEVIGGPPVGVDIFQVLIMQWLAG